MLQNILTEDMVQVRQEVRDWQTAIKLAAFPLIEHSYITENYVNAMIRSVDELGPYIVIAPDIAIAHARPDHNVKKVGLSLLKLNKSVNFAKESHFVSLVFVLAAVDNEQHLEILTELASFLMERKNVERLKYSSLKGDIMNIINQKEDS